MFGQIEDAYRVRTWHSPKMNVSVLDPVGKCTIPIFRGAIIAQTIRGNRISTDCTGHNEPRYPLKISQTALVLDEASNSH